MEQVARRENRTLSELVRESFWRYQQPVPLPTALARFRNQESIAATKSHGGVTLLPGGEEALDAVHRLQLAFNRPNLLRSLIPSSQNVRVVEWNGASLGIPPFWKPVDHVDELPLIQVAKCCERFEDNFFLILG